MYVVTRILSFLASILNINAGTGDKLDADGKGSSESSEMKLVVGLGNPGLEYERTRHNVGFEVIDLISTELGAHLELSKNFWSQVGKTKFKNTDVVFLKPQTYMNESGRAVSAVIRWFKLKVNDVLIVHDDVSIPLGRIRLQKHGGAGGQHGVESIIDSLGGVKEFDRIKVGVGPDPGGDLRARYVLSRVPEKDRELFAKSMEMSAQAVREWLEFGPDVAANHFNGRNLAAPPEPPESQKKPAKPPKPPKPATEEGSEEADKEGSGTADKAGAEADGKEGCAANENGMTENVANKDGSEISA